MNIWRLPRFKIQIGLELMASVKLLFLPKNSLSNENSNAGDTRFEDVPVIIGQPNLVSSFFRTFSSGISGKFPENFFLPS